MSITPDELIARYRANDMRVWISKKHDVYTDGEYQGQGACTIWPEQIPADVVWEDGEPNRPWEEKVFVSQDYSDPYGRDDIHRYVIVLRSEEI